MGGNKNKNANDELVLSKVRVGFAASAAALPFPVVFRPSFVEK